MSVLDNPRTGTPTAHRSANRSKWEHSGRLYQKHLEWYLDAVYRRLRETDVCAVLDAGCGEGIVYRALRARGYDGSWTGFDFSREAVEFARGASPEAHWHHASAYELPYADRGFDLVFSSQVLEHLTDPHLALREYARVSKRWLLLSVPLEPYFRALTWLSVKLSLGGDPGHVNHWTPASFRSFAGSAGRLQAWEWTTVYQIVLVDVSGGDGRR